MAIRHAKGSPPGKPSLIRRAIAAVAATGLVSIGLVASSLPAEAHTPRVSTTCDALTVDLQSYQYRAAVPAQGYTEYEWTKTTVDTKTSIDSPGDGWVQGDAVAWEYVDKHGRTRWEDSATWNAESNPQSFGWELTGNVKYEWSKTTVETTWAKNSPGSKWTKTGQERFHETAPAQPEKVNTVVVTIDGTQVANTTFATSFNHTYNYDSKYVSHTYNVAVTAWDDPTGSHGWTKTFTGSSTACEQPTTADATANVTVTPATCTDPATAAPSDVVNATLTSSTGTTGPGDYSFTFTANSGHTFADGTSTETFTGTLAGPIGNQSTNPSGACYVPPVIQQCTEITNGPVSTNLDPAGWDFSESRTAGFHEYVAGGLHVWTTPSDGGNTQSKSAGYIAVTPFSLALVGAPSIEFASYSGVRPSLQLGIDRDGNGTWDGYLVYEPWAYGDGNWWTNKAGFGVPAGMGYPSFGTLQQFLAANPNAKVISLGYSLGSGVIGDAVITKITVGCTTYTFNHVTPPPVEVTLPLPTVVDKCGVDNDSLNTVPVEGVRYEGDGWSNPDGTFTINQYAFSADESHAINTEGMPNWDKITPGEYDGWYINEGGVPTFTVITQNQPCGTQPPDKVVVTDGTPVCGVDTVDVTTTTTPYVWNPITSTWDLGTPKAVKTTRAVTDQEKAALNCPTTSPSPTPSPSTSTPVSTPSPTHSAPAELASTGSNAAPLLELGLLAIVIGGLATAAGLIGRRRQGNQENNQA
jgi:hypothetical protein